MTIVASGEISLGVNATTTRSVACELGLPGTSTICMNQAAVRTLAGVPSGQISFSNFYGKSNVPPGPTAFGQVYCGGYYFGTSSIPAGNYYLILSPCLTGYHQCAWITGMPPYASISGKFLNASDGWANNRTDGATGTFYPAGNWTATRSINGYSDWYIPSVNETTSQFNSRASMPAGQGYCTPITNHISSTRFNNALPCCNYRQQIRMNDGVMFCASTPLGGAIGVTRIIRRQLM